jgi:hypothetical protein
MIDICQKIKIVQNRNIVLDWLSWPPRWPHILNSTAYQVRVDVIRTMIEPILLKIHTSTL